MFSCISSGISHVFAFSWPDNTFTDSRTLTCGDDRSDFCLFWVSLAVAMWSSLIFVIVIGYLLIGVCSTSRGVYRYGKSYRYAYLYRIVVPVFCTGIPCCCWSQPCRHLPFTSSPISFSRPPFILQSGLVWKKPDRPEWRRNRRSRVSWHTDYCFFLLIVLTSDTPKYCRRRTFFNLWRHSLPLPSVYFK